MMNTLGCCDSGLGGMLIVDALHKAYPKLNIVFIADQKNVPYGDKSDEKVQTCARDLFSTFQKMNIHDVVVACNTLCTFVDQDMRESYSDLNIHSIIEPTCFQLKGHDYKKIGVIATSKTIEKHAYLNPLVQLYPNADIFEIKASKLVPIIENGCDEELLKEAVCTYCQLDVDAWILGCTHYPIIRPYLDQKVDVYDSIQAVIDLFKNEDIQGEGIVKVYTSGDPEQMKKSIHSILKTEYDVEYLQI